MVTVETTGVAAVVGAVVVAAVAVVDAGLETGAADATLSDEAGFSCCSCLLFFAFLAFSFVCLSFVAVTAGAVD